MGNWDLLDEVIVFDGLWMASGFVELGDQQFQNRGWHGETEAEQRLSQLVHVDSAAPVSIEPIEYSLLINK